MLSRLLKLLPSSYRKKLFPVACSIFASTLLNLIGIAVILPIFILLLSGGDFSAYPFLEQLRALVPGEERAFVLLLALAIVLVLALKFLLSQILLRYQVRYILSIYKYFSSSLLNCYYSKGYLFIKDSGTTDLSYKINSVCYAAATLVFQPILTIAAEGTIAVVTLSCIFALSPFAALAILCSFIPAALIYSGFIKTRLSRFGRLEYRARSRQFGTVQEIFGSFPSVELNQAFPKLQGEFSTGLQDISSLRLSASLLSRVPGFLIELTIIICVVLLMLISGQDWSSLSLSLAFFCAGALRILPALRSVLSSLTQIKNNSYAVDTITEALSGDQSQEADEEEPLSFRSSIEVRQLGFDFPDRPQVLKDISFSVAKGEKIGIRGISGSGKSTLFNLLLGLYTPQSGQILIDSVPLSPSNKKSWQRIIGYVPQEVNIISASIAENIAFSTKFNSHRFEPLTLKELLCERPASAEHFPIEPQILERIQLCLEQAQLSEFVQSLPDGIYTQIGENGCKLSGGQRQRIGIARALFKHPELLFFDEATSSLDPAMEKEVNSAIVELAKSRSDLTMFIIAHRPESLAICDKIIDIQ